MSMNVIVKHNNISKKIPATKSTIVSQVADVALTKFGLGGDVIGVLKSQNKVLDSSLPLRLTGISNNSVLTLETVKNVPHQVQVKLTVVKDSISSKIGKISSDKTLADVIVELGGDFEADTQLSILDAVYTKENYGKTLARVIGTGTSIAMRLNYVKKNELRKKEQEEIVRKQIQNQREWIEKKKREKEAEIQERDIKERKSENADKEDQIVESEDPGKHGEIDEMHDITASVSVGQKEKDEVTPAQSISANKEASLLFMPTSTPVANYENSDEDYSVTSSQIEALHRSIVRTSKNSSQSTKSPTKYQMRIRFPDQEILQLNFPEAQTLKLGQLVRKIDDVVRQEFVGNYSLRTTYPSREIEQSFTKNNSFVSKMPEFNCEQVSLLWVPKTKSSGPFIKPEAVDLLLDTSRLPEMVSEQSASGTAYSDTKRTPSDRREGGKKIPKWFANRKN